MYSATATAINKELSRLNPNKAFTIHSIPSRVLKENKDILAPLLTKIFNNAISQNEFPDDLKLGVITPLFKQDEATDKGNYRPIIAFCTLRRLDLQIHG